MKFKTISLCLASLSIGVASMASSYSITFDSDTQVGEIQLKAGIYRLRVQRNHAIFQEGRKEIPVPVTVEKNAIKPQRTVLDTIGSKLQAIELGGTNIRLVFSAKPATSVGE